MTDDPFAKLGALDQRLFQASTPPSPSSAEKREGGKEGSRETGKEGKREASLRGSKTKPSTFDINQKPYRKDSYLFTDEEFEAMEDLKIELRRKYDLRATKNDLARCAIGNLLADFQEQRGQSVVVKTLRSKK